MADKEGLSQYITLVARFDATQAKASLTSMLAELTTYAEQHPLLIPVKFDTAGAQAQLDAIGKGGGGGNGHGGGGGSSAARAAAAADKLRQAEGGGGGGGHGGRQKGTSFGLDVGGWSSAQIESLRAPLSDLMARTNKKGEDLAGRLNIRATGKGSSFSLSAATGRETDDAISELLRLHGQGLSSKAKISGTVKGQADLDDLMAVISAANKANAPAAKAAKPKAEPKPDYASYAPRPFSLEEEQANRRQAWVRQALVGGADPAKAEAYAAKMAALELQRLGKVINQVLEPLGIWKQMLHDIGQGRIRPGVAKATTGGLKKLMGVAEGEESAIASGVGAMSGGIVSSLALPIAWAIGNAIMALPGMILDRRESSGRFRAGGRNAADSEAFAAMEREKRRYWEGVHSGGGEAWVKGAEYLQDANMSPRQISETMDRLSTIAQGSAGAGPAMAQMYAEMERLHNPASRFGMVMGNPALQDQIMRNHPEIFGHLAPQFREQKLAELLNTGMLGNRDIELTTEQVAEQQRIKNRVAANAGSGMGLIRGFWEDLGHRIAHPNETDEEAARTGLTAFAGPPEAIPQRDNVLRDAEAQKFHPELMGSNYSWSGNFSGLAEQMQSMWSGAPATAMETTADTLGRIETILNTRLPGGPPSSTPEPAAAVTPP
jgi:hypothetical protein